MDVRERATQPLDTDARRASVVAGLRATHPGVDIAFDANTRRWIVGSGASCDVVVADPYVSAMHCVLERRPSGALHVRDARSRNGTLIDGNRVDAGELRVGSSLSLGRTTFVAVGTTPDAQPSALEQLRGRDPVLRATIDVALRAAPRDCNVLIVGETGTGKDLLARIVHESSRRAAANFVPVNCGGIPRELIGSELFGHEKGAFTGAHTETDGLFARAHGGTLFLDEIGELPLEQQPHLLRALENRTIRRVGSSVERTVDVRIIAATNRLEQLGTEPSTLRRDLYHRLATVVLVMPPLRDRIGDVVELVEYMLGTLSEQHGHRMVSDNAWRALAAHPWPGNVRELRQSVERAVTLGGDELQPEDFLPDIRVPTSVPRLMLADGSTSYQQVLRGAMEQALQLHGTIRAAAAHLGMPKSTFADRAQAWGLLARGRVRLPRKRHA